MAMVTGHGRIFRGTHDLGEVDYLVHLATNGQGTLVELHPRAPARDGAVLHLMMQDGRFVVCQNIDHSHYCAVVGEGPSQNRRITQPVEHGPRHTHL